jgi:hypothetical protein
LTFTRKLHQLAGRNATLWEGKQSCFSLSFDVDFFADVKVLPMLVAILDEYSIKASFAVIGMMVEQYPAEHKLLVGAGHEIVNHTYSHPNHLELTPSRFFDRISLEEQEEEIRRCDEVIRNVLGVKPIGFRTPHFGNQYASSVYGILRKLGYLYSSSTVAPHTPSFGYPFKERQGIWEFPVSTCPMHPFTTFDTWHAFHKSPPFMKQAGWHGDKTEFFRLFKQLISVGIENGSYVNLYFDPQDVLQADLKSLLLYLIGKADEVCVMNYQQIVADFSRKRSGNV